MKKSHLLSTPVPKYVLGRRYHGVQGKVVQWVEHTFEEGLLYIHVRFTDKTELSWRIATRMTIEESDLADWTPATSSNCESLSATNKTGACDAPQRLSCLRLFKAGTRSNPDCTKSWLKKTDVWSVVCTVKTMVARDLDEMFLYEERLSRPQHRRVLDLNRYGRKLEGIMSALLNL